MAQNDCIEARIQYVEQLSDFFVKWAKENQPWLLNEFIESREDDYEEWLEDTAW